MKKLLFLLLVMAAVHPIMAQQVYQIRADSVRIYNVCDTAELILENRTSKVNGYLFNKGNGRTEFRKIDLVSVGNHQLAIAGQDTIDLRTIGGIGIDTAYRSGDSIRYVKNGVITRIYAPLPAPEGYILNQMSTPQTAQFNIKGEGRTSVRFAVVRNGSHSFMNSFTLLDTTGIRGANMQLTGGDTAGLAFYVHSGAFWAKRFEIGPSGVTNFYSNLFSTGSFTMGYGVDTARLNFQGSKVNYLAFPNRGIAPPSFGDRSIGTKIIYFGNIGTTTGDFASGLETQHIWQSVPQFNSTNGFKWYGGTTEAMKLSGDGVLTIGDKIRTDVIWGDSTGLLISGNNSTARLQLVGGGTGMYSSRGGQINLISGGDTTTTARGGITFHAGNIGDGTEQLERMRLTSTGKLGIGISGLHSTLHVNGSVAYGVAALTGSATLHDWQCNVTVNNAANANITLPTATNCMGREYTIVKISSSAATVTVATTGGELINNATTYLLATQYKTVTLWSNGTQWLIKYAN